MSDKKENLSPEFLNAFVDDQLTAEEKAEAYEWINQNYSVTKEICEIRKVQDLVKLSYRDIPEPPDRPITVNSRKNRWLFGIAASLTLVLGIFMGTQIGTHARSSATSQIADINSAGRIIPADINSPVKLLVHVNSGDNVRLKDALDEIEGLMKYYQKIKQPAEVELIANGKGIKLLGAETSPYAERVKRLQREHKNLTFIACQNTLDSITEETGYPLKLIPGTVVIDSGVAQIMRRQNQGWAYIQV